MVNPYEAPSREIRYLPFGKRLRRALVMARAEYRAGLKRDGVTRRDHIKAWLGLIFLACFLLLTMMSIVITLLIEFGIF